MALRGGTPRRRHILPVARAFFTSNPPFPPPPANDPDAAHSPSSPGAPRNPASSLSQGIRDSLRSFTTSPSPHRIPTNLPRPNPARGAPYSERHVEDIRQKLRNFRKAGGAPSTSTPGAAFPSPSAPGSTPSITDMFRSSSAVAHGPNAGLGVPDLDSNRGSLKGPQPRTPFRTTSANRIFRRQPERNWRAVGAGQEENGSAIALKRSYTYDELGKRLGELRPAGAGKDGKQWFSLTELQGRIAKLAELEKQEKQPAGAGFAELRRSFENLQKQGKPVRRADMLALQNFGGGLLIPNYMDRPPQEELLEKYFHPDHMSSEEKMKLELQRVRDEFKMSENDCGSARVQIAQLTLKIKHLSAVLHKKDKHSRKGLQEMVQRRKKYLKYLRRTDWDSYSLVLSKLGLREVPEYKVPDYKSKATTKAKSKKKIKSKGKKRKVKA